MSKCHNNWSFLHWFATENTCESHKKLCENKDFCGVVMPSEILYS